MPGFGPSRWLAVVALACGMMWGRDARPEPPRRPAIGPYLDGKFPAIPPSPAGGWAAVPAFPRLTFEDPTFLVPAPGGGTLFVGSRQGVIWSIADDPNVASKAVFLDIRSRCQGWDDGGLLALAFHPEFGRADSANRGFFYVWYSQTESPTRGPDRPNGNVRLTNRLARFTVPDGSDVADPNSELVLIDQYDENIWHNGGGMFFRPDDGFLYLSLGDEGGDYGNTQRIDKDLFSGVIRIDVDRRGGSISHPPVRQPKTGRTAHYFLPNDNPWVGVGDALEEFWAIGLRSPHRMTFDPVSKRIWLGDVGEGTREEVNLVERGGNYQWQFREGTANGPGPRPSRVLGIEKPPVHEYGRESGVAVIGGYVYRGSEHAASLGGKYVFGDNTGRIWAMSYDGSTPARVETLCDLPVAGSRSYGTGLSSFGVDLKGELYLCQLGHKGAIFRLARTGAAGSGIPDRLSRTGAFADLKSLRPNPGLVAYTVNSPLWSDGAAKSRWIGVPDGTRIGFRPTGEWSFPEGTVFVKHFEIGEGDSRRRLETRFLIRNPEGAYGVTYRWRNDGSDADRVDEPADEPIAVKTSGGIRQQTWHYPGRRECMTCHTPAAGYVLGANTRQLNGTGPDSSENQISTWGRSGLLEPDPSGLQLDTLPRLSALDSSAELGHRVRSYLDSNCAHCHRPGGVRARFDARFEAGSGSRGLVDAAVANALGVGEARVVVAGDPGRSIAHRRLISRDQAIRMPPLATSVVDTRAAEAMKAWISAMPAAPAVKLAKPADHAVLVAGSEVTIEAEISGGGRPVREVEFLRGDSTIGKVTSRPYRLSWKPTETGSFAISARAIDDRGNATTSPSVMTTVNEPKAVENETGVAFLSDLRWSAAENGYGPIEKDRSNGEDRRGDGGKITLGGVTFSKGLGVHANSRLVYRLDGKYTAFLAEIGLDSEVGDGGSVVFQVWADGEKRFDSGLVRGGEFPRPIRVDVTGRNELILIVTDGGDDISSDHADWAGARLVPKTPRAK